MKKDSISDSVSKIAGLTLINALVFQEVLADYEPHVQHLRQTLQAHDAISAFADHWEYIWGRMSIMDTKALMMLLPALHSIFEHRLLVTGNPA